MYSRSRPHGRSGPPSRPSERDVAESSSAVTDTHAVLFYASGSRALGPTAARLFSAADAQQAIVYVPAAVIWEVNLLARAGRINLRRPAREFFADLFSNPSFQPHDLNPDQIYAADELRFNRDPFDALIVAAAQSLDLPLVTRDADVRASGAIRVIW
jgi:PIN domain nuclease of toxin-antitoxin system